ncbi:MAG: formylglycine-generating enzyme family protein [Leptolyngbyaceae cyanobacterium bins.302]|nr:formylglycine-generating enzyme family protein [Leptolyngbyaceae cyanobacterium bins.302]
MAVTIEPSPDQSPFAKGSLVIHREKRKAQYFPEDLGNGIVLDMVLIPSGTFLMGSPADEPERNGPECPQHQVTVPSFFMGKYPVTQAQWRVVAAMPEINRSLNSSPSSFRGNQHPVESVSWFDAVEFCDRLSRHTGRPYQLPSEAEWEYACRARTTTPFHCGETITPDLANYDGNYTYRQGLKGIYRKETTPVGSLAANAFGLYDMHGNVWEWCLDHRHGDYEGAPTDSSAWIDSNPENGAARVLRSGSWNGNPRFCRSAARLYDYPALRHNLYSFRVVCHAPRTL